MTNLFHTFSAAFMKTQNTRYVCRNLCRLFWTQAVGKHIVFRTIDQFISDKLTIN